MDKNNTCSSAEDIVETPNYANCSLQPETIKKRHGLPFPYTSLLGESKNFKRAPNRGRKGSRVLLSTTYPLRSSENTSRVLRSRSVTDMSPIHAALTPTERATKKPHCDDVHTLVKPCGKRTKRGRSTKTGPNNGLSKIRNRIRNISSRMNYQKTFLEAYASEGWKKQSLEKIRPEKDLEQAKAEIVRCKLKIREAFQNLDNILAVGKPDESLFRPEGTMSYDNVCQHFFLFQCCALLWLIFCATCSLQHDTLDNDIILCDGACDRGFHQNCLNPPLLTKDIPEGEQGWLCPACDCKIDCIELINEVHGTNISINDSWEKVFPEAAAVAHGPMKNDVPDLPSDDSEDDDFDPNISEEHVAGHVEGPSEEDISDSDDSNFITSSDNSEHVKEKEKVDDLELPSDDSEDDDYDPAGPDSDKDIKEKQDESDFISDSADFCADIAKSCGKAEVLSCPKVGDHTTKDLAIDQAAILPSRRRQVQRLDYKTLYDDAYGEAPSDSSDGGEWSGQSTLKDNEEGNEVDSFASKSSRGTRVVHSDGFHGSNSNAKIGQFGPIINERLGEQFKTDQYPSRVVKQSLAQELRLTFCQETMVEIHNVCKSDALNEDTPPGILNEGITQDGPLKHGIGVGPRTNVSPTNSSKRYTIHYVRRRKGESSRENDGKNGSASSAGRPKGGDAEYSVLALEAVDEKTRNKMLPQLKKRKIG